MCFTCVYTPPSDPLWPHQYIMSWVSMCLLCIYASFVLQCFPPVFRPELNCLDYCHTFVSCFWINGLGTVWWLDIKCWKTDLHWCTVKVYQLFVALFNFAVFVNKLVELTFNSQKVNCLYQTEFCDLLLLLTLTMYLSHLHISCFSQISLCWVKQ